MLRFWPCDAGGCEQGRSDFDASGLGLLAGRGINAFYAIAVDFPDGILSGEDEAVARLTGKASVTVECPWSATLLRDYPSLQTRARTLAFFLPGRPASGATIPGGDGLGRTGHARDLLAHREDRAARCGNIGNTLAPGRSDRAFIGRQSRGPLPESSPRIRSPEVPALLAPVHSSGLTGCISCILHKQCSRSIWGPTVCCSRQPVMKSRFGNPTGRACAQVLTASIFLGTGQDFFPAGPMSRTGCLFLLPAR